MVCNALRARERVEYCYGVASTTKKKYSPMALSDTLDQVLEHEQKAQAMKHDLFATPNEIRNEATVGNPS